MSIDMGLTREVLSSTDRNTVIPRLTSDPDNEFFQLTKIFSLFFGLGYRIWIRLTNVLVDARANIKQQT